MALPKFSRQYPNNGALCIAQHKRARKETLESVLSSAVKAEDSELEDILRSLSELSEVIKSGTIDPDAADNALKKTAIWAVKQSLVDREVRSLAITDDLTGFFNRRGFLAAASQQLRLAHRDRQNVLLFFCDVDNLKTINDSFGHREGDLAIVRTADALEETFRESDVISRYGGDEFAVLAWEASTPQKEPMLARLGSNLRHANAEETR